MQATILKEDLAGFVFESNRGTKHTFTADTSLGPEFAQGWTGTKRKRLRSKIEALKLKVKTVAREIYEIHFKANQMAPRGVVTKLTKLVDNINNALNNQKMGKETWCGEMKDALHELSVLLLDDHAISSYELHTSGIVQSLLNTLTGRGGGNNALSQRIDLFVKCIMVSSLSYIDKKLNIFQK